MMVGTHEKGIQLERTVLFSHCDLASTLFTPRALDLCLEAIDEF